METPQSIELATILYFNKLGKNVSKVSNILKIIKKVFLYILHLKNVKCHCVSATKNKQILEYAASRIPIELIRILY